MSKSIDFSNIENIASVERIDDQGGTFIDIRFTNGARVRIAPENDVIIHWATGEFDDDPRTMLFCDMGSGHHTPGEPTHMLQQP